MKKLIFCIITLLFIVVFTVSCNRRLDVPMNTSGNPTTSVSALASTEAGGTTSAGSATAGVTENPNSSTSDTEVCLQIYSFQSFDEFRHYCNTGSVDPADYPLSNMPPPFPIKDGMFFEPYELFSLLTEDKVTITHIELDEYSDRYSYSGYVNESNTPFTIIVSFDESLIGKKAADAVTQQELKYYDRIIYEDYFSYIERTASETLSPIEIAMFVFDKDGLVLKYKTNGNKLDGVDVVCNGFTIRFGTGTSDNREKFFADDTLIQLSSLFQNSEKANETLSSLKALLSEREIPSYKQK